MSSGDIAGRSFDRGRQARVGWGNSYFRAKCVNTGISKTIGDMSKLQDVALCAFDWYQDR